MSVHVLHFKVKNAYFKNHKLLGNFLVNSKTNCIHFYSFLNIIPKMIRLKYSGHNYNVIAGARIKYKLMGVMVYF
jgi:hypothetical protein